MFILNLLKSFFLTWWKGFNAPKVTTDPTPVAEATELGGDKAKLEQDKQSNDAKDKVATANTDFDVKSKSDAGLASLLDSDPGNIDGKS